METIIDVTQPKKWRRSGLKILLIGIRWGIHFIFQNYYIRQLKTNIVKGVTLICTIFASDAHVENICSTCVIRICTVPNRFMLGFTWLLMSITSFCPMNFFMKMGPIWKWVNISICVSMIVFTQINSPETDVAVPCYTPFFCQSCNSTGFYWIHWITIEKKILL